MRVKLTLYHQKVILFNSKKILKYNIKKKVLISMDYIYKDVNGV